MDPVDPVPRGWTSRATRTAEAALALAKRHWIVLTLFGLALYLRLNGLFPAFFYGDDAEYAAVARALANNPFNLEYPNLEHWDPKPFVSQPPVVLYVMALGIRLFGATPDAVVGMTAFLGALTVVVVYAIGATWRGRTTGAAAAAILAVMPYHVSMSRRGFVDAGFALFLALTVLMALLWYRRRETKWAVLTGVAMGLAIFSKLPGILAIPILGLFLALELVAAITLHARRRADPAALPKLLRHVGAAALSLTGVFLLYILLLLANGGLDDLYYKLLWQAGRVSPEALPPEMLAQFSQELTKADRHWTYYFTEPHNGLFKMVGHPVLYLAAAGVTFALVELIAWKRRENLLLVAWPLLVFGFFAVSQRKEWFYLTPVAPAIALFAGAVPGAVFDACSHLFVQARASWHRPAAAVAVLLVFATVAVPTYAHAEYSSTRFQGKIYGAGYEEAARYIDENGRPDSAQIGNLLGRFTLYWYNERPTYHWYTDHQVLEYLIETGKIQYLVTDNYLPLEFQDGYFETLLQRYNAESVKRITVDWGVVEVWEFHPAKSATAPGA